MNDQPYEQEINLSKMFYRILRDWREIFVIAVIISITAGAGNFAMKKIKTSNSETLQKLETNYNRELAAFNANGETLQREIENLEESREEREDYNVNSILMKINPLREYNASLQIYIATNYQIMPGMNYQNIDLSSRILHSYFTYMVNGDMYQYVIEHMEKPMELRYLKEVLSVTLDEANRMVTLYVRGVDAGACEEILMYAMEGICAKQPEIAAAVGEHSLNTVNQAVYEAVNLELDEWQKQNIQYVSDLSIKLQEKAEEFTKWESSPEPEKQYTASWIVKDSVKKMILGFMAGVVFAAVFIALKYIMSGKLQDAKELKKRFGLRVVAQIPRIHKKRVWIGVDRLFAYIGGLTVKESEAGALAKVAVQSVKAELAAVGMMGDCSGNSVENGRSKGKGNYTGTDKVVLAFTGNISYDEVEKILSVMDWGEGYSALCAPNILSDPLAVSSVMGADYVILVEKQELGTYSQIERELEELKAWKKKVLGVIVVGVDAVP